MKKIIIVADLGHFKAYEVSRNPLESPRIELKKSYDIVDVHGKMGEKLSDEAGRFAMKGGKKGIKGYGEPHNIELENKKKLIKQIASDINGFIKDEKPSGWYLAASKAINNQILKNLEPSVKGLLEKNIMADLTKKHKTEILECFK
ncbi:MAG: hypothetical protein Fur0020_13140 [Thermodesulfovibrionia bacterium]